MLNAAKLKLVNLFEYHVEKSSRDFGEAGLIVSKLETFVKVVDFLQRVICMAISNLAWTLSYTRITYQNCRSYIKVKCM